MKLIFVGQCCVRDKKTICIKKLRNPSKYGNSKKECGLEFLLI